MKRALHVSAPAGSSPLTPAAPRRSRRRLSRRATWLRYGGIAVALLVVLGLVFGRINVHAIQAEADRLNGFAAFGLLVVLPLLGFPASVLHVATGLRFGAELGLLLVTLSIGLQLLASYALVSGWRDRFARRFDGLRKRIPQGAHASIAIFAVLIPGAPFAAINYVLPLLGVRLRTYLLCCWPLHTLRSTITVLLGGEIGRFNPTRLTVLALYTLLLCIASAWMYRRLRRQLGVQPGEASDRMLPA